MSVRSNEKASEETEAVAEAVDEDVPTADASELQGMGHQRLAVVTQDEDGLLEDPLDEEREGSDDDDGENQERARHEGLVVELTKLTERGDLSWKPRGLSRRDIVGRAYVTPLRDAQSIALYEQRWQVYDAQDRPYVDDFPVIETVDDIGNMLFAWPPTRAAKHLLTVVRRKVSNTADAASIVKELSARSRDEQSQSSG